MSKEISEYDENGNLIYFKDFYYRPNNSDSDEGYEEWYKYDENSNLVHHENSDGEAEWYKYDENNRVIYGRDTTGLQVWLKYDENNERISITQKEFEQIKFWKAEHEFLSREEITRFELMEFE